MATLDTLRTVVATKIGMQNSGTDQDLLDLWANEGQQDLLLKTGCNVAVTTITLTAGDVDYTIDDDIMLISHMIDTAGTRWQRITFEDMIEMRRSGGSGNTPMFTTAGSFTLLIWPTPTAADSVTLYYVPRPVTMTADGDTPDSIPAEFHKAIEWYMLWQAGDYVDDQTSEQGERYRSLYNIEIAALRRYISLKGGGRLAPVKGGRRRRVPHDNSTYLR